MQIFSNYFFLFIYFEWNYYHLETSLASCFQLDLFSCTKKISTRKNYHMYICMCSDATSRDFCSCAVACKSHWITFFMCGARWVGCYCCVTVQDLYEPLFVSSNVESYWMTFFMWDGDTWFSFIRGFIVVWWAKINVSDKYYSCNETIWLLFMCYVVQR